MPENESVGGFGPPNLDIHAIGAGIDAPAVAEADAAEVVPAPEPAGKKAKS